MGERLRALRARELLTQRMLCERSGVSVQTINRIERSKLQAPRYSTLRKLAAALGVEPRVLAGT